MRRVLDTVDLENDIGKGLVLEQSAEIVGQSAFWHDEFGQVRVSVNVDTVLDDADFAEQRELIVGQEAIALVHQKISPNELFEAPVFA